MVSDEPKREPKSDDRFDIEWYGSFKNNCLTDEMNRKVYIIIRATSHVLYLPMAMQ